ncbi:alkaline phosphatase D family protein [Calidithermus chliarophilus]|uniref:alkaline phosphatase D family protein n=1 Tax=Calidithermus chliarophilus TaxID=52023 RepID=UPI000404A50F|nr:alkaline phosphatase D family protein [Calidithermus chliarophilus]
MKLNRREVLGLGAGLLGLGTAQSGPETLAHFPLGVASGDPSDSGVVLWTRLAPEVWQEGEGLEFEITEAADPAFAAPRFSGPAVQPRPENDFTSVTDLSGLLEPGRAYLYRFRYRGVYSPVGRTRTLPAPGETPALLRIGLVTCQEFTSGYWGAFAHLARENLDAVLHLGDFIYETSADPRWRRLRFPDRSYRLPSGSYLAVNLADYRAIYRAYRSDPFLQMALAAHPWVFLWDDHEMANDYYWDAAQDAPGAPDHPYRGQPERLKRLKLEAQQAWLEYVPARITPDLTAAHPHAQMTQYRSFRFGGLLELFATDTRSYRSPHPCGEGGNGQRTLASCAALEAPDRSMLGEAQRHWLLEGLASSPARWRGLASAVMFSPLRSGSIAINADGWDGYAAERQYLLEQLVGDNLLVLSGDLHAALAGLIRPGFNGRGPVRGAEFMAPGLSSPPPREALGRMGYPWPGNALIEAFNRHLHFFEGELNGYAVLELTPEHATYSLYSVDKTQNHAYANRRLARRVRFDGRGLRDVRE